MFQTWELWPGLDLDAIWRPVPLGSCRILPFWSVPLRPHLSVGTHGLPPMSAEMHERGLPRPDHPGTWDIGTTYRRLVSVHGLVVSVVFPPPLSALEIFPSSSFGVGGLFSSSGVGGRFSSFGVGDRASSCVRRLFYSSEGGVGI